MPNSGPFRAFNNPNGILRITDVAHPEKDLSNLVSYINTYLNVTRIIDDSMDTDEPSLSSKYTLVISKYIPGEAMAGVGNDIGKMESKNYDITLENFRFLLIRLSLEVILRTDLSDAMGVNISESVSNKVYGEVKERIDTLLGQSRYS